MYKKQIDIILEKRNVFNISTVPIYEDLIINKKKESSEIYYKNITLKKDIIYRMYILNNEYFDCISDINIYYNIPNYLLIDIQNLPRDINILISSYLFNIDAYFCSNCFDNELKMNKLVSQINNDRSSEKIKNYTHKLKLYIKKLDGNNKKIYNALMKDKFPLLCTKYSRLYIDVISPIDIQICVNFKGTLLSNDIRRDLSQNTFRYKSNIIDSYLIGMGCIADGKIESVLNSLVTW